MTNDLNYLSFHNFNLIENEPDFSQQEEVQTAQEEHETFMITEALLKQSSYATY